MNRYVNRVLCVFACVLSILVVTPAMVYASSVVTSSSSGKIDSSSYGSDVSSALMEQLTGQKAVPKLSVSSLTVPCSSKTYNIRLNNATDAVTWKSSNSNIVAVHMPAGVSVHSATKAYLVIRHPGKVTISASYKGKIYTCVVTVKENRVQEANINGKRVTVPTYYGNKTYTAYCQGEYGSDYINKHGCGYCAIATIYNVFGNHNVNGKTPAQVNGKDIVQALGERQNGIGFWNITSDLTKKLGVYPKVKSVVVKRNTALATITKQLVAGYPVLAHITNVDMMTGTRAANIGEKLGGDVHVISILGLTEKNNFVIGNSNGTVYNGRQGVQIVPQKVLLKYLLNTRPDRSDAGQVNNVSLILIDNHF